MKVLFLLYSGFYDQYPSLFYYSSESAGVCFAARGMAFALREPLRQTAINVLSEGISASANDTQAYFTIQILPSSSHPQQEQWSFYSGIFLFLQDNVSALEDSLPFRYRYANSILCFSTISMFAVKRELLLRRGLSQSGMQLLLRNVSSTFSSNTQIQYR